MSSLTVVWKVLYCRGVNYVRGTSIMKYYYSIANIFSSSRISKAVTLSLSIVCFFEILGSCSLASSTSNAIGSYYTDGNQYETSNFYANAYISNDSNTLIKEKVNKYTTMNDDLGNTLGGKDGSRKIYNTIIIKTRKKSTDGTKTSRYKRKTILNNSDTYKTDYTSNENKITFTGNNRDFRSMHDKYNSKRKFGPFMKTTPDGWYVYALGSFSFSTPSELSINALDANGNRTEYGIVSAATTNTRWSGGNFGGTLGMKAYFNKDKVAVFISPELFYSNLNINSGNTVYNSRQHIDSYVDPTTGKAGIDLNLPVDLSLKPKSIFGGSLRLGTTFFNTISVFGKVNLGAMLANISVSPRADAIDWETIGPDISKETREAIENEYRSRRSEAYNRLFLMYGFGCGVEFTAYNQHLIIRLDYDYNFVNEVVHLNGTAYRRITDGSQRLDDGDKWKMNVHFGTIKLSVGFAI